METAPTTAPDYRTTALSMLAELQLRKHALREALAPYETQVAALQKACSDATAAECTRIENLEAELKRLALLHSEEIFGDERSIQVNLFTLGIRPSEKVEIMGDEDEVISALQRAAKQHPDPATRVAAEACLRVKIELNKPFIREKWDAFQDWFTIFGLKLTEQLSAAITERKPAKPKPSKPLKGAKPETEEKEAA